MSEANWGGAYAGQHVPRYNPQQGAVPPHPYTAQQGYAQPQRNGGQDVPQGYQPPHQGHASEQAWSRPAQGGGDGGGGARLARTLHGSGALMSLALIAGLGIWGYQLAMRDVTGVPVVRALEGPMRIQPVNPGGVAAAHQGLAVNAIAAAGQAEGPANEVALAPSPVALEDEDLPAHGGEEVSAVSMAEAADAPPANAVPVADAVIEPQTASLNEDEGDDVAAALAMANAVAAGAAPLTAGAAPLTGGAADLGLSDEAETRLAAVAADIVPTSVPGVARSPRPQLRPDDIVARAAASPVDLAVAAAAAATTPAVREVSAAEIATGTRLVQLGAFDSEAVARDEWIKVSAQFPEMLEGKSRVIEKAQSGGKTFYRLRAMGFDDLSDARRFCAALMAGQAACIPVVTR